jgi:hypothetical protein
LRLAWMLPRMLYTSSVMCTLVAHSVIDFCTLGSTGSRLSAFSSCLQWQNTKLVGGNEPSKQSRSMLAHPCVSTDPRFGEEANWRARIGGGPHPHAASSPSHHAILAIRAEAGPCRPCIVHRRGRSHPSASTAPTRSNSSICFGW